MLILAPRSIPLKQFPTSSKSYQSELEGWLQSLANQSLRYTGSISKQVGKQTFTVHTFVKDAGISKVKVVDSSTAGIVNYPPNEVSLANSVTDVFTELNRQGWNYSGAYFKKIGTANYVYLVFYQSKKPKTKPEESEPIDRSA